MWGLQSPSWTSNWFNHTDEENIADQWNTLATGERHFAQGITTYCPTVMIRMGSLLPMSFWLIRLWVIINSPIHGWSHPNSYHSCRVTRWLVAVRGTRAKRHRTSSPAWSGGQRSSTHGLAPPAGGRPSLMKLVNDGWFLMVNEASVLFMIDRYPSWWLMMVDRYLNQVLIMNTVNGWWWSVSWLPMVRAELGVA